MSLEQSMQDLAASNTELAAAMRNYAAVMQSIAAKNPDHIVTAPQSTPDSAPPEKTKSKRRTQAEIAADAKAETAALAAEADTEQAGEADPFADEAEETTPALTAAVIRDLVLRVKAKNASHALQLLEKVGVKTLSAIPEAQYPKVVELAKKVGVEL
jgi:hypothetical protein